MAPLPGEKDNSLSRAKIFDETCWIVYCCCQGWGCGSVSDPLIGSEEKTLCIRGDCSTTDISAPDGLCSSARVLCCCSDHCAFPPSKDFPACICLNMKCGPTLGESQLYEHGYFKKEEFVDETFWIYYFLCSGWGVNKCNLGLFNDQDKCLCVRQLDNCEPCCVDGVMCSEVRTCLCIWGECQCPPAQPNPCIACFGIFRLNNEKYSISGAGSGSGADGGEKEKE
jgi:hypothetical protein